MTGSFQFQNLQAYSAVCNTSQPLPSGTASSQLVLGSEDAKAGSLGRLPSPVSQFSILKNEEDNPSF